MSEGLNVIVCIKQVPETTEVEFDEETGRLKREGVDAVINPFDEYAVEEGLQIKEKYGGTVKVLSMGPPQAESALRETIALGCDEAYLATDRAFAGADTWATSYTLGLCVEKLAPYDIVICGLKTTDGDTGQVGPEMAQHINQPRLATLRGRMGARKAEIKQITSKDVDADPARLGLDGSPTRVVKIFTPTPHEGGDVVEGTPEELAESIFQKLLECKVI
jgi:electron transfer flavoprotein beta subunit